jgi:hypothetical protein
MFMEGEPALFFVEGLIAAAEVKAVLTGDELERAIKNSKKFKSLIPQELEGSISRSNSEDQQRFYERRPYFLFAYESDLKLETVAGSLAANGGFAKGSLLLDAAFLLDRGVILDLGRGEGGLKVMQRSTGKSISGWVHYAGKEVLIDMMIWLSIVMPRVMRFGPILPQYLLSPHQIKRK